MIKLIYDKCTPTADRRPTTLQDVEEDIVVVEFDNEQELLDHVANLCSYDEYDLEDVDGETPFEKAKTIMSYCDDLGDGSPNFLYLGVDGVEDPDVTFCYDCLGNYDLWNTDRSIIVDAIKKTVEEENEFISQLMNQYDEDEDEEEYEEKKEDLNEDSHTVQAYKDWINEPTFEEDKDDVIEDIKNNNCLTDGEKLELLAMISKKTNESFDDSEEEEEPEEDEDLLYYDQAVDYIEEQGISCDPGNYIGEYVCDLLDDYADVEGYDDGFGLGGDSKYYKSTLDWIIKRAKEKLEEYEADRASEEDDD